MCVEPIETESLYHFHPGARVLRPRSLSPSFVTEAQRGGAQCVALPAHPGPHLSAVLVAARICREIGLLAVGGISGQAASEGHGVDLGALDAATVDLTTATDASRLGKTLGRLSKTLDRAPTWVEVVVRVVPGQADTHRFVDEMSRTVASVLGPDVPVHLDGLLGDLEARRQARWIAISNGLHWVYVDGPDPSARGSWCPGCDSLLVERGSSATSLPGLSSGACSRCGRRMPGRFAVASAGSGGTGFPHA